MNLSANLGHENHTLSLCFFNNQGVWLAEYKPNRYEIKLQYKQEEKCIYAQEKEPPAHVGEVPPSDLMWLDG